MKEKIKIDTNVNLFGRENFKWMIIGAVVLTIGFILMAGGHSKDEIFDEKAINGFRRITLAPFVIIAGFVIEAFAIMKKNK